MRFILISFSLFLIYFKLTNSECVFDRFSTDFQPLFFQKFGYEKLFIPVRNSRITIPEAGSVEVYCPYGYRKLNNELKDGKKVKIRCIHNTYSMTYDDESYSLDEDEKFQCKKPTTVLQSIKTYTCGDSDAFILSFEYDSINIALAEICYDFSSLKFQYVYYVSAKRTTALSALSKLSVVDNTTFNNPIDSVSNSLYVPPDEIKIQTKLLMGSLAGAVEYIFKPLVPLDVFNPFVTDSLEVSNQLTNILWWKPLREGNWKIYQRTLKSFTDKNAYDVIAGVSGIAPAYNSNFRNKKEIKIEVNGLTQDAPKFIWNYLIPRNKNVSRDYRQEFVVIGYNSPFIDGNFTNDLNRYSDVCGDIIWLEPLNDFRKQYPLGYIFCLQPVVARFFLDGFPSADAISYRGRVTKATNISPEEPSPKQNATCPLLNN